MPRAHISLALLPLLVVACKSTPTAPPPRAEAASSAAKASEEAPKPARKPVSTELAIWSDPAFKRRFAESLLSEVDIEPRLTVVERESMQQALDLIAEDKQSEALQVLEANRGELACASFDFMAGSLYFQQDDLDRAVPALEQAVAKHPKFRRAWQSLGWARFRSGEYAEAIPALTKVIELGGVSSLNYGMLAFSHANLKNPLGAETAYRMAVMLDPQTLDWKMGLAEALFKQQRFADAVALCGTLIAEQPESSKLWMIQANAYIGMGKPAQAAQNIEFVDSLGQSSVDALNLLGDIYINEELYELAGQAYLRALEKSPEAAPTRALRAAKDLAVRGAASEARLLAERIEALHGSKLEAEDKKNLLRLRARLAAAASATPEEVAILEEIVSLDPLDGDALILLGQHASKRGEAEKAVFYYERAAALEAFEADAKVRHAELLVGQSKYAEALPLLRRAQALKPRESIQQYLEQVERVAQSR
ncbi:MAG: tetratricopeptide repeat protein [Planctomycetes bacterium]|nr:tetratricopeptide repeat protein [Planctomycetota bacterium]